MSVNQITQSVTSAIKDGVYTYSESAQIGEQFKKLSPGDQEKFLDKILDHLKDKAGTGNVEAYKSLLEVYGQLKELKSKPMPAGKPNVGKAGKAGKGSLPKVIKKGQTLAKNAKPSVDKAAKLLAKLCDTAPLTKQDIMKARDLLEGLTPFERAAAFKKAVHHTDGPIDNLRLKKLAGILQDIEAHSAKPMPGGAKGYGKPKHVS